MQTREKLLAGAFAAVIGIGWVVPGIWSAVRAPVTERETTLRSLKRRVDTKENDEMKTMAAIKKIADWKKRALPEDALTAQRIYQAWLTRLADEAGWSNLDVVPGRTRAIGPGTSVSVAVDGIATAEQLATFLDRFEASGLLHSIERSNFVSDSVSPDAKLEVSITATALSLPDGGPTPLPYAEFRVTDDTEAVDAVAMTPTLGKVTTPFDVATSIDDKTYHATVKKSDDEGRLVLSWRDAVPQKLEAETKFVTQPLVDPADDSIWQQLADAGPFSVPRPKGEPVPTMTEPEENNDPPVIAEIEGSSLLPGQEWTAAVSATDPDGEDSEIKFSLENAPPGSFINNGELFYSPARDSTPGEITWNVVATDAAGGRGTREVTVKVLTDPERTTRFVGSVRIDGKPAAWFIDDATEQRIVHYPGDEFVAGRFKATIDDIGDTSVVFVSADASTKLSLGNRVYQRQSMPNPVEPSADPAAEVPSE